MKSYEVKQISPILSHFYNLEKMKNICFYCIENNIFSNYSGWAASKLFFFEKCAVFTASMAEGMCNWFLNRTGHCGSAPF